MSLKILNGLDVGSQLITNVGSPSAATDAANKAYVDNLVQGMSWKSAVRAATTANITLSAPQTVDGVSVIANDRVLVKNQSTASQNGIYIVNAGAWTRASDMDTAAEFVNATVYVSEGTTNADTAWTSTVNAPVTVNTTNIPFAQVGGGQVYTAGNGIAINSNVVSVNPVASGGIAVAAGGVSVDTAIVVRKYAANVGNGSLTSIAVTHNLNTQDVTWSLREVSTNAFVIADAVATDANTLTLTFATAPASNAYRVVVHA